MSTNPTPTRSSSFTPRPIATASLVPSITPIPCLLWSQITPEMAGDDVCVYGTVKMHKENKDIGQTFFYFGTVEQFFVTSLYRWSEPQEDICMQANGVIQLNTYKVPYMKIDDTLYPCGAVSAAPAPTKPALKTSSTSTPEPTQFTSGSKYSAYEMTVQVELTQWAWDDQLLVLEALETQNAGGSSPYCDIKGNISMDGDRIYHVPGGEFYDATVIDEAYGERWFCSEDEARANGWRKSNR